MPSIPTESLPLPGEETFAALAEEDRAWLEGFYPWYRKATTRVSPRLALLDPRTASFGPTDLRQFVKFYPCNAPVFDLLLAHLLGHEGQGGSVEERHSFWRRKVEQHIRSSRAAE